MAPLSRSKRDGLPIVPCPYEVRLKTILQKFCENSLRKRRVPCSFSQGEGKTTRTPQGHTRPKKNALPTGGGTGGAHGRWTGAPEVPIYELRITNYDFREFARKARSSRANAQRNFENNAGCWLESVRSYAMPSYRLCDIVHSTPSIVHRPSSIVHRPLTLRHHPASAPCGQKLRFCPTALTALFACALHGAVGRLVHRP